MSELLSYDAQWKLLCDVFKNKCCSCGQSFVKEEGLRRHYASPHMEACEQMKTSLLSDPVNGLFSGSLDRFTEAHRRVLLCDPPQAMLEVTSFAAAGGYRVGTGGDLPLDPLGNKGENSACDIPHDVEAPPASPIDYYDDFEDNSPDDAMSTSTTRSDYGQFGRVGVATHVAWEPKDLLIDDKEAVNPFLRSDETSIESDFEDDHSDGDADEPLFLMLQHVLLSEHEPQSVPDGVSGSDAPTVGAIAGINGMPADGTQASAGSADALFFLPQLSDSDKKLYPALSKLSEGVDVNKPIPKGSKPRLSPIEDVKFQQQFSESETLLLRLSDCLLAARAPLHLLDQITTIVSDVYGGKKYPSHHIKRDQFISNLQNRFRAPQPRCVVTSVEGNSKKDENYSRGHNEEAKVVTYDFMEVMAPHLLDPHTFGNLDNVKGCVNPDDPFQPPIPNANGDMNETVDGDLYRDTLAECKEIAGDEPFVMVPCAIYTDKTGTDVNSRYPVEPLLIAPLLLNTERLAKTSSWKVLAYIPELNRKSKAQKVKDNGRKVTQGRSVRNYHTCLKIALSSFHKYQGKDVPVRGFVRFGNEIKYVRLFFPLFRIQGDALSADTIVARKKGYQSMPRISRCCDCPSSEADNVFFKCRELNTNYIDALCDRGMKLLCLKEEEDSDEAFPPVDTHMNVRLREFRAIHKKLSEYSQHVHESGLDGIWIGCRESRNISRLLSIDPMHAFLLGLMAYTVKIYMSQFSPSEKVELDLLSQKLYSTLRSGARSEYPRANFNNGISNLTMITANEWAGLAMTIVQIAVTRKGKDLMDRVEARGRAKYRPETLKEREALQKKNREQMGRIREEIGGLMTRPQKNVATASEDNLYFPFASDAAENSDPLAGDAELDSTPDGGEEYEEEIVPPVPCSRRDIIEVLEMQLTFYDWYRHGRPFHRFREKSKEIQLAIAVMLSTTFTTLPREAGAGWKLQKVHELLHLVSDTILQGPPEAFDAGRGENALQGYAKHLAQLAAKRGYDRFLLSVADRLYVQDCVMQGMTSLMLSSEREIESKLHKKMGNACNPMFERIANNHEKKRTFIGRCRYVVHIRPREGDVQAQWMTSDDGVQGARPIHPGVIEFLQEKYRDCLGESIVQCFTHFGYEGKGMAKWYAHPNFRSDGAWFEWAMVVSPEAVHGAYPVGGVTRKRSRSDESGAAAVPMNPTTEIVDGYEVMAMYYGHAYCPAKILCFYLCPESKKRMAIVHTTTKVGSDKSHASHGDFDTVLTERWQKRFTNLRQAEVDNVAQGIDPRRVRVARLTAIDCEHIHTRVLVTEDNPVVLLQSHHIPKESNDYPEEVSLMRPPRHWRKEFFE